MMRRMNSVSIATPVQQHAYPVTDFQIMRAIGAEIAFNKMWNLSNFTHGECMSDLIRKIAAKRPVIHIINSIALIGAIIFLHINLLYIMIAGSIMGLFGGKLFCRWFCPMGLIMEKMMPSDAGGKAAHLYQYYKLGCPIAWASGLANRISLFRISRDRQTCVDCGACDRACYIASLKPEQSLYRADAHDASRTYNCSKCLACVQACPKKSLSVGILTQSTTAK